MKTEANKLPKDNVWGKKMPLIKKISKKQKTKKELQKSGQYNYIPSLLKPLSLLITSQIRTFVSHRKKESHTGFEKHESEKMIHIFR